jgi:hypothetical protein
VAERAQQSPSIDTVLEPGDSLYLPRGYLHSAVAVGETSVHLTVGIHPLHRHLVARHLLTAAQDDAELRSSLPMGVDWADPIALAPHLADVVAAMHSYLDTADPVKIAALIGADLNRRTRPAPLSPLAQLNAYAQLGADTSLTRRAALRTQIRTDDTDVVIALVDKLVRLPGAAESAIKVALSGVVFTPADLPGLEADEQIVVAKRLLREGILVPADPSA